ncbi:hypothetical protein DL93DRAFT_2086689, partial [Clavulina sp. PMI_390]
MPKPKPVSHPPKFKGGDYPTLRATMLQSIGIPYADSDSDIDTNTDLDTTSATKKNADSTSPESGVCQFAYEKAKRPM